MVAVKSKGRKGFSLNKYPQSIKHRHDNRHNNDIPYNLCSFMITNCKMGFVT